MAASRKEVDKWIETAKKEDNKFILSVCDTFDWEDYPVYFKTEEELMRNYHQYNGINMQRINELIRINDDNSVDENLFIENLENLD